jgi:hypothetical protein
MYQLAFVDEMRDFRCDRKGEYDSIDIKIAAVLMGGAYNLAPVA